MYTMKECLIKESFADGNVGAAVRLMARRGCLPVRGSERMTWKYEDDKYRCGPVETEKHVFLNGDRKRTMERGCKRFERWYG